MKKEYDFEIVQIIEESNEEYTKYGLVESDVMIESFILNHSKKEVFKGLYESTAYLLGIKAKDRFCFIKYVNLLKEFGVAI